MDGANQVTVLGSLRRDDWGMKRKPSTNPLPAKSWSRSVRSDAKKTMIFTGAFAVAWNLIVFPMAPYLWREGGALMGLIFPAVGIGLICYAVQVSKQWRRYGITRLTLDPYPGSIGGHVGGHIDVAARAGAQHHYEVTLECVYSYMSGSGKNRSRSYDVVWQARGPAEVARHGTGLRMEFRFEVPAELPESEKRRGAYHLWRVVLKGDQPKVPLDRTFDIAVMATAKSSQHIQVDTTSAGRDWAAQEIAGALTDPGKAAALRSEVGLTIEQHDDRLHLLFHPGRQKFLAAIAMFVGVLFVGVGLYAEDMQPLMHFLFGVIGVLGFGYGTYVLCNSLDVRISPREIKRVRSVFGFVIRRQSVRPNQLRKLEIAKGATTNVNDKTTVYYRLVARGSFGKFRLVDGLADRGLVEAIRDQVMICAGLKQT